MKLLIAGLFAMAGAWGFFLAAAAFVFQPAQVGPDHGAWGAIAGVTSLAITMVLAARVERESR